MYTQAFQQTGNSCAAATLMIALHEKNSASLVNSTVEAELYKKTQDPNLGPQKYSSPENIINTAKINHLDATLYKIPPGTLDATQTHLLNTFVDSQKPQETTPAGLKKLLDEGWLQLLTYVDGDKTTMHWLLLRKNNSKYYLYDTAYGNNQEVAPDTILNFDADFNTGRKNNFLGIVIHLK